MKPNSMSQFFHLLKFHLASVLSLQFFWFVLLYGCTALPLVFFDSTNSNRAYLPDILFAGSTNITSIWYGILLGQFLNIQGFDSKKMSPRFMGESEFISTRPLSLRMLFISKVFAISLIFGGLFLPNLILASITPHLEIIGSESQIPLLNLIRSKILESSWVDPTQLHLPNGSWISVQFELIIPLSILLMTLSPFYFLRKVQSTFLIGARGAAPIIIAFMSPMIFMLMGRFIKTTSLNVSIFLWFYEWRYWLLGCLILGLFGFVAFLAEKAEAREEF